MDVSKAPLILGCWLILFGIWPIAHPPHSLDAGPLFALDLMLHVAGAWLILSYVRDRLDSM